MRCITQLEVLGLGQGPEAVQAPHLNCSRDPEGDTRATAEPFTAMGSEVLQTHDNVFPMRAFM